MKSKKLRRQGLNAYVAKNNPTEILPVCFVGTSSVIDGFSVALYVEGGVITGVDVYDNGNPVCIVGSAVTGERAPDDWYEDGGLRMDEWPLRDREFVTAGTNVPQEPQVKAATLDGPSECEDCSYTSDTRGYPYVDIWDKPGRCSW